jgi:hypothetical protein
LSNALAPSGFAQKISKGTLRYINHNSHRSLFWRGGCSQFRDRFLWED